ncbi:MAG: hypothetical protein IPG56_10165 [Caulobacteraceae bacterium]|nr:hypothetical protein [Caulobacteraceae bacterium]
MSKFGVAAIAALAAMTLAAPAHAGVLDNFQIKLGVSGVLPDEQGDPIDVDISDEFVPSLQIEYFFNDHVSAELLCCVATHDVTAASGTIDLGQVTHFPPTVTLKYRWTNFGQFEPYVGAASISHPLSTASRPPGFTSSMIHPSVQHCRPASIIASTSIGASISMFAGSGSTPTLRSQARSRRTTKSTSIRGWSPLRLPIASERPAGASLSNPFSDARDFTHDQNGLLGEAHGGLKLRASAACQGGALALASQAGGNLPQHASLIDVGVEAP